MSAILRTGFQYHHLNDAAKKKASKQNKSADLTELLYNEDGSRFIISTEVKAYLKKSNSPK